MQAELQSVEVQFVILNDDDLSIEDAAGRQRSAYRVEQLGEVAVQWLFIAALNQDLITIAEQQRAKAIPLRLENPISFGW